jgi:hypothetical protein
MNSIVAANLFENPLVLATIVLVGALANWLVKRRGKAGAVVSPNERESPLPTGERGHPTRQPDLQDILRQLLGGEPPVMAPSPPPVPRISRDDQTPAVERDEEPFHSEQMMPDESQKPPERLLQQRKQAAEQSSALAPRIEADDRHVNAVNGVVPFDRQAKYPIRAMGADHRRHSSANKRPVRLWHDGRTVRRAFVASLIFAPPKGLEA